MSMTEQELLNLKEKVDEAKTTAAELKGELTGLMKQLKDNWKCETIKEAQVKLKEIEKDVSSLETKIEKGIEELEELYNPEEDNEEEGFEDA